MLPAGETRDDPLLGRVQIYRGSATIELPISSAPSPGTALSVVVTGQTCADTGVCHTPDTRVLTAAAPPGGAAGDTLTALETVGDAFAAVLGGSGDGGVEFLPVDEAFQLRAAEAGAGRVRSRSP